MHHSSLEVSYLFIYSLIQENTCYKVVRHLGKQQEQELNRIITRAKNALLLNILNHKHFHCVMKLRAACSLLLFLSSMKSFSKTTTFKNSGEVWTCVKFINILKVT